MEMDFSPSPHHEHETEYNLVLQSNPECSEHIDWKCHHHDVQERIWNLDSDHEDVESVAFSRQKRIPCFLNRLKLDGKAQRSCYEPKDV